MPKNYVHFCHLVNKLLVVQNQLLHVWKKGFFSIAIKFDGYACEQFFYLLHMCKGTFCPNNIKDTYHECFRVVENDMMTPFCICHHVDIHLDMLVSSIRSNIDIFFGDWNFSVAWFLVAKLGNQNFLVIIHNDFPTIVWKIKIKSIVF